MKTVNTIVVKIRNNALVQGPSAIYLCSRSWLVFNKH